LEEEN
jgi:hypothetical protein